MYCCAIVSGSRWNGYCLGASDPILEDAAGLAYAAGLYPALLMVLLAWAPAF
ncbi:hypothetical protein DIPPA_08405 [Diplonema papillatum]|nr:hypothetical protein DIPPA_08405 [Diplonema papillatum]